MDPRGRFYLSSVTENSDGVRTLAENGPLEQITDLKLLEQVVSASKGLGNSFGDHEKLDRSKHCLYRAYGAVLELLGYAVRQPGRGLY